MPDIRIDEFNTTTTVDPAQVMHVKTVGAQDESVVFTDLVDSILKAVTASGTFNPTDYVLVQNAGTQDSYKLTLDKIVSQDNWTENTGLTVNDYLVWVDGANSYKVGLTEAQEKLLESLPLITSLATLSGVELAVSHSTGGSSISLAHFLKTSGTFFESVDGALANTFIVGDLANEVGKASISDTLSKKIQDVPSQSDLTNHSNGIDELLLVRNNAEAGLTKKVSVDKFLTATLENSPTTSALINGDTEFPIYQNNVLQTIPVGDFKASPTDVGAGAESNKFLSPWAIGNSIVQVGATEIYPYFENGKWIQTTVGGLNLATFKIYTGTIRFSPNYTYSGRIQIPINFADYGLANMSGSYKYSVCLTQQDNGLYVPDLDHIVVKHNSNSASGFIVDIVRNGTAFQTQTIHIQIIGT